MDQKTTQRRRPRSRRARFWKRYGPTVELLLICGVLLAALVFVGIKLISLIPEKPAPETTAATDGTQPDPQPETQAPTEPPETQPQASSGVIYLTFDDGPSSMTPRLLEILDKYDAKATFFFVNTEHASTIAQVAEAGHSLAMHTATHEFEKVYASDAAYFDDLYKIQSVIEQYSGRSPKLLRFPGGSSNRISRKYNTGIMTRLTQKVEEMGYTYFDWNVDSDDAGSARSAEEVYFNVIRACAKREKSVVLMHDIYSHTIDAVEGILIWGTSHGYTFEALTEDSPTFHHDVKN